MARQASFARRDALLPIMYGNPAKELERIELERAYIELAQDQAELVAARAEADQAGTYEPASPGPPPLGLYVPKSVSERPK